MSTDPFFRMIVNVICHCEEGVLPDVAIPTNFQTLDCHDLLRKSRNDI